MTRVTHVAAVVAGLLLFASNAQAQDDKRFYVGVFTGSASPDNQDLLGHNAAGALRDISIDYDSSAIFGANIGFIAADRDWGRTRFEVELSKWESDVDALSLNDKDRVVVGGSESSVMGGFINAWYDTPRYFERVRFSVGAGFGIVGVDNELEYLVANPAATGGNVRIGIPETEVTYAYQLMAGMDVELNPSWSLVADVRKVEIGNYQAQRYIRNTPGIGSGNNGTLDSILDADWSATTFTAGLRYKF